MPGPSPNRFSNLLSTSMVCECEWVCLCVWCGLCVCYDCGICYALRSVWVCAHVRVCDVCSVCVKVCLGWYVVVHIFVVYEYVCAVCVSVCGVCICVYMCVGCHVSKYICTCVFMHMETQSWHCLFFFCHSPLYISNQILYLTWNVLILAI